MSHPMHGPSTPRDEAEYEQGAPATTGQGGTATPARAVSPVPPRPVFQSPPGYDTLSPASPYTVVFEPWPDTPPTATNATAAAPPAADEAGQAPWSQPDAPVAEASTPAGDPAGSASSAVPSTEDDEPSFVARPYATWLVRPQPQTEPASADEALASPTPVDPASTLQSEATATAPAPDAPAPAAQPYIATQPYVAASPSSAAVPQPYVATAPAYIAAPQPPAMPSFVPTSPYGGPAAPQPFPGSSSSEPDPYLALYRQHHAPPQFGSARPRTENVGRGLAAALIAVLGGCVLSAFVYHLGFVASIVALAMGAAGIFLYAKGAGAPPRKGAFALVVLLIAGILLAWLTSVGTELYLYYVDRTGTSEGALAFALESVLSFDLFKAMLKDFLIFVGFGLLGIFGVARQLLARRAR